MDAVEAFPQETDAGKRVRYYQTPAIVAKREVSGRRDDGFKPDLSQQDSNHFLCASAQGP
eukprot:187061-Amphidinium_carterae.1